MQLSEQRDDFRMPLFLGMNEYINERPQRCMTENIGTGGVFVRRLQLPETGSRTAMTHPREQDWVNLEFQLPGTSETIWAAARVCFDQNQRYFRGTGLSFAAIADMHLRLIRDYVIEHRERELRRALANIRRRRRRF